MNAKNIYLIGLDLALNQNTGDTHAKESSSGVSTLLNLDKKQERDTFSMTQSLIKVKGNFSDFVYTTPLFFSSIKYIENQISINNDTKIFNLSKHGAYLEGTISKKIEDINLNNLNNVSIESRDINTSLINYSRNSLSLESKYSLNNEINFLQKDMKRILEDILSSDYINFNNQFLNILFNVPIALEENHFILSHQIIVKYFDILIPYLLYHFNDIKMKNESKKVMKVKAVFVNQIEKILDDYILCLKRVL